MHNKHYSFSSLLNSGGMGSCVGAAQPRHRFGVPCPDDEAALFSISLSFSPSHKIIGISGCCFNEIYRIRCTRIGQFQAQEQATQTLMIAGAIAFAVISVLIYFAVKSIPATVMIMINLPLALIGGVISVVVLFPLVANLQVSHSASNSWTISKISATRGSAS